MAAMEALLGGKLVSKAGEVATADAIKGAEVVGIYFSAHWCGPCRGFTPQLAKVYEQLKAAGKGFEVVFASSDRDQAGFDEYFGEMPWLALPFDDRDRKNELSKKYKVRGIPTLVIVDAATGATVTTNGRGAVADPEAFPWTPPTLGDLLSGVGFVDAGGAEVQLTELCERGAYLGLYFSAHWCPPCRGFTPQLVKTYNTARAAGHDLEIAFLSSDRSEGDFKEYFGEMPWRAVPFADRARKDKLSSAFDVSGIPSFVLLKCSPGGTVELVNKDARSAVMRDPEAKAFPWVPPLVSDFDQDSIDESIEEIPNVIAFAEEAGEAWEELESAMSECAKEAKKAAGGADKTMGFYVAKEQGGLSDQVRKMCRLGKAKVGEVRLVMLDLAEGGAFYGGDAFQAGACADAVAALVRDFGAKKLERKKVGAES